MMNFRNLAGAALIGLASLTVAIAPANAAACRGPNGRFIKCSTSVAAPVKAAPTRVAAVAKPRTMAQTAPTRVATIAKPATAKPVPSATPARVQTAAMTHRAAPKTAKPAAGKLATVAPKKG